MSERPPWFDGCIIGAVFSTVLLSASVFVGAFTFVLNLVAVACFVAPIVAAVRNGDVGGGGEGRSGVLRG